MCGISYIRRPSTVPPFFCRGCSLVCALYCKRTSRSPSPRRPRCCLIAARPSPAVHTIQSYSWRGRDKRSSIPQNNNFAEFITLKFVRESRCIDAIHEPIKRLAYCITIMHRYALIIHRSHRILMHTFALLYIAKRKVPQKKRN